MLATMVGRQRKINKQKKNTGWNALKHSPKTYFGPKYKCLKTSYLEFFFWKYCFGNATFLYWSTRFSGHHQLFFLIFRFSSRKSQSQQKQAKKSTPFAIQFRPKTSLILRTSTHLTLKIICSRNTVKNLSVFRNFWANMFLFGIWKNICFESFLDAQELHSWSTLKANVCNFCIPP